MAEFTQPQPHELYPNPSARSYAETFADRDNVIAIDSDGYNCRGFIRELLQQSLPQEGAITLGIGCGEGKVERTLRRDGAKGRIIGIDSLPSMIAQARQKEQEDPLGIRYLLGSALDLPFKSRSIDLATMINVDGHFTLEQTQQADLEVARVIKPGGRFIKAFPNPWSYIMRPQTPGVVVHTEGLAYNDNQQAKITLRNAVSGKEHTIPTANFHRIETYLESLQTVGFAIQQIFFPVAKGKHKDTYQQVFGKKANPFGYVVIDARKKVRFPTWGGYTFEELNPHLFRNNLPQ